MKIPNFPWLKLIDIKYCDGSGYYLSDYGRVLKGPSVMGHMVPVVTPDNVYNVYNLEDIKIPKGYEIDGKNLREAFRYPLAIDKENESYYLVFDRFCYRTFSSSALKPAPGLNNDENLRLCLRRIKPKTVKYLVVSIPVDSDGRINKHIFEGKAEDLVQHFPSVYRLEERPLKDN